MGFQGDAAGLLGMATRCVQQPHQAPCDQTQHRQSPFQPFGGTQLQFLQPAAALQCKVVALDEPARGIPAHHLGRDRVAIDWQRGQQQPADRGRDVFRGSELLGQQHLQRARAQLAALLSVVRRLHLHAARGCPQIRRFGVRHLAVVAGPDQ